MKRLLALFALPFLLLAASAHAQMATGYTAQVNNKNLVVADTPSTPHPVACPTCTVVAGASFTTPSGTSAYASGNLIANSATAGSVTPMSFSVCRTAGGSGMVRRARIKTPDTGFAAKTVALKLYRDSPTNTNGDHGAWLTTESNYLGSISVTLDQTFSDAAKGIGAPTVGSEINFDCATGSQLIYGELVAGAAITPQGAMLVTVVLEALVN